MRMPAGNEYPVKLTFHASRTPPALFGSPFCKFRLALGLDGWRCLCDAAAILHAIAPVSTPTSVVSAAASMPGGF
jgi:hypothetical protein